jgi:hypothetical protein
MPVTDVSFEEAAVRVRSTADRVVQLRKRLVRLEQRDHTTPEDVERARRQAITQAEAVANARRRLLAVHRAAVARHEERARRLQEAGRPDQADREREAAQRQYDAYQRCILSGPPQLGSPRPPGAERPQRRTAPPAGDGSDRSSRDELGRLRAGVVALLAWGGDAPLDDVDRRTAWCRAVVDECGTAPWHGWLHAVCVVAARRLHGIRGVAVTVAGEGGIDLTAASDTWTARTQELELIVGEGPAVTARSQDRAVVVDDLSVERHLWQGYASAASGHGIHGVWALPLHVCGVCVGTVTFYRWAVSSPPTPQLADLTALAGVAGAALVADMESARQGQVAEQDLSRLSLAAGVLAARLHIPAGEAEARIRARAFSTERTLTDVAQEVIDGYVDRS